MQQDAEEPGGPAGTLLPADARMRTSPALGRMSPASNRNRVVLPAPLGPMIASASPGLQREIQAMENADSPEGALESARFEQGGAVMRRHRSGRRARRVGRV